MTSRFYVRTTSAFERWLKKLAAKHGDLLPAYRDMLQILEVDPYNRTRTHLIKKLSAVPRGDGQYRVRAGRWRFRYDIYDDLVLLTDCSLRRENTYR